MYSSGGMPFVPQMPPFCASTISLETNTELPSTQRGSLRGSSVTFGRCPRAVLSGTGRRANEGGEGAAAAVSEETAAGTDAVAGPDAGFAAGIEPELAVPGGDGDGFSVNSMSVPPGMNTSGSQSGRVRPFEQRAG